MRVNIFYRAGEGAVFNFVGLVSDKRVHNEKWKGERGKKKTAVMNLRLKNLTGT